MKYLTSSEYLVPTYRYPTYEYCTSLREKEINNFTSMKFKKKSLTFETDPV